MSIASTLAATVKSNNAACPHQGHAASMEVGGGVSEKIDEAVEPLWNFPVLGCFS